MPIKSRPATFVLLMQLLLMLPVVSTQAAEADFPVPASIRPAINFWTRVYTEVDTNSGFLHDSQDLSIVYQSLQRDTKYIDERRKAIIDNLRVLATGKRSGLTEHQKVLLSLWGENTPNARFEQAAQNVRWQLGQSDRFREGLARSGAYRKHIEEVVKAKGLPPELGILPHVESSFHPGAFSSAAASGMWQFMRDTAVRYMRVDLVVDDRLDPYTSTNAAMELLKYNYEVLGTWPLALTAYNHGTGGMARAVRDAGTRDIGLIISDYKGPRFGFASRNFYPQFIAALELDRNAEKFYGKVNMDPAPDFVSLELPAYVEAKVLADNLGIDLATLRKYNPALLSPVWNGNKRIPKGFVVKVDRAQLNGNSLQAGYNRIAATNLYLAQIPDVSYTVRSGDSLSVIAARFNTSVAQLASINQLQDRNRLRVGQTLVLPQGVDAQQAAAPVQVASVSNSPPPVMAAPAMSGPPAIVAPTVASTTQTVSGSGKYQVKSGDTISGIARRYSMASATLMAMNGLDDRSIIHPGQELLLRTESSVLTLTQDIASTIDADLAVAIEETSQQFDAAQVNLSMDPYNYEVAADGSIEIHADETLGHYAGWLQVSSADLRRANGLNSSATVRIGNRLKLDFSKVDRASFLQKRRDYHANLQALYFATWRIRDTENYSIKNRDLLVTLAQRRSIPLWLFRQYNPGVDADALRVGQVVVFPVVERITN
jgi:membrane-bound lytic murein transglycosylase D